MKSTAKAEAEYPDAVVTAFWHVKAAFPEVTQVTYDEEGRWLFTDATGNAPDFEGCIDVGLLEAAAESLTTLPITLTWVEIRKQSESNNLFAPWGEIAERLGRKAQS